MEETPKYLEQKGKMERLKIIARFRYCNEWRGERYWEKEGKVICRICNEKKETWFHIRKNGRQKRL